MNLYNVELIDKRDRSIFFEEVAAENHESLMIALDCMYRDMWRTVITYVDYTILNEDY